MSVASMASLDAYTLRLACLPAPFDRVGTLWKRGRGKRFSFIRPWVQREIVLDCDSRRLFYKSPAGDPDGVVRGSVLLDANSSVHKIPAGSLGGGKGEGQKFGFEIVTSDGSLELAADHEADQTAWLQAIQSTIQQDIICEAKIQKKVFDTSRRARKEKELEADKIMKEALLENTKFPVKKSAEACTTSVPDESGDRVKSLKVSAPPPIPKAAKKIGDRVSEMSTGSTDADLLFAAESERVLSQKLNRPKSEKVMLETDLSDVKREIKMHQAATMAKVESKTKEEEEKRRMLEEVKGRDRKVAELRRKNQVRANFRAAVKRSVIQYKFLKQMEDSAKEKKIRTGKNQLLTKEDTTKMIFSQGDTSDTANAIEKMLAKKKLERQMQKNVCKKVAFDIPPPTAPTPAPSERDSVNHLFTDLGGQVGDEAVLPISERIRGASIGPPSSRPLSQRPPSGLPPNRPSSIGPPSGPPPQASRDSEVSVGTLGSIPPPPPCRPLSQIVPPRP